MPWTSGANNEIIITSIVGFTVPTEGSRKVSHSVKLLGFGKLLGFTKALDFNDASF